MWKELQFSKTGECSKFWIERLVDSNFTYCNCHTQARREAPSGVNNHKNKSCKILFILCQSDRDCDVLTVESVYVQTVNTGHVHSLGHVSHHPDLHTIYGALQQVPQPSKHNITDPPGQFPCGGPPLPPAPSLTPLTDHHSLPLDPSQVSKIKNILRMINCDNRVWIRLKKLST